MTFNRTLNDRALPEYFTPTELGSRITSPYPGYIGVTVTGNGFSVGFGAVNPGLLQLEVLPGGRRPGLHPRQAPDLGGRELDPHEHRDEQQPADQRGLHVQRPDARASPSPTSWSARSAEASCRATRSSTTTTTTTSRPTCRTTGGCAPNLLLNLGLRWEPFRPIQNDYGWVSHFDKAAFDQGPRSTVYPQAPRRPDLPGRRGFPRQRHDPRQESRTSRRASAWCGRPGVTDRPASARPGACSWTRRTCSSTRASPTTRRGARRSRSRTRPAGSPIPTSATPAATRSRPSTTDWPTAAFPAFGVYVNTPLDIAAHVAPAMEPQRAAGGRRLAARGQLPGQPLEPPLASARAEPRRLRSRRDHRQHQPAARPVPAEPRSRASSTGPSPSSTTPAGATTTRLFLQVQRRLKNNLSVLSNWTLSKCMSDPATTEITGPTVVDPNNPDLDYSYCASDRRHVVNLSVVWTTPQFGNGVAGHAVQQLADLAAGALAERQPFERDDRRGQRALHRGTAAGQRAVQILDDPYGDGTPRELPEPRRLHLARAAAPTAPCSPSRS